jgi:hypothetical protein
MAKVVEVIEIDRPPEVVYRALIVDAIGRNRGSHLFRGVLGQLSFELLTPEEISVGSRIKETIRTLGGYETVLIVEVTELVPGAKYGSKLTSSRRLKKLDKVFLFEPINASGTRVTMSVNYGITGIFARGLELMIANRAVHQVWRTALTRLKSELEASAHR